MVAKKKEILEVENNPQDLYSPPKGVASIKPPVEPRVQELPFNELSWENFERLCFRLSGKSAKAEFWQRYGRQGQAQGGIDIYIRLSGDKYDVWQCKRYKSASDTTIKNVVSAFKKGDWVGKTDRLCLCISAPTDDTKVQDEIEKQATKLKKLGITFLVWGPDTLSGMLKEHPELVDDFFGRKWVEVFLGKEVAESLSSQGQTLDGAEAEWFRTELLNFYSAYFQTLDRGLLSSTSKTLSSPQIPSLRERFIIPDVQSKDSFVRLKGGQVKNPETDMFGDELGQSTLGDEEKQAESVEETYRCSVGEWLASGQLSAVIGDAGSGKSTLLRCVALDLLSGNELFPELAECWGNHLPVLIPFARWTQKVAAASSRDVSLEDMVCSWFSKFSIPKDLIDLIPRALQDRRLLLLVDGLDEWANESAALTVLNQLEVAVTTRGIPAVLSGRPLGIEKLGGLGQQWRPTSLAPLTNAQQRDLAKLWFTTGAIPNGDNAQQEGGENLKHIDWQVETFFQDLQEGGQLHALAGIPLLLTGLIVLHIRNISIPNNRFQAYAELTKLLLEIHPKSRSGAAADNAPRFDVLADSDLRLRALGALAFETHMLGADSGLSKIEADRIITTFLKDEDVIGLPGEKAKKGARELLAVNAETSGILIEKSPDEVGFIHAVFEEYLAAIHVAAFSLEEQKRFVVSNCSNPRWRNTILAVLRLLTRPTDVDELIGAIEETSSIGAGTISKNLLLAESVFGESKRTARVARRIANDVLNEVEIGTWEPLRESLLKIALGGIADSALRDGIEARVKRWFPDTQWSRRWLIDEIASWPNVGVDLLDFFWRGLHDPDRETRLASARAIANVYRGSAEVEERLIKDILRPADAGITAAFLKAIAWGWPDCVQLSEFANSACGSGDDELELAGITARIALGWQGEDDLAKLLDLAKEQFLYEFRDEIIEALCDGWDHSELILDACYSSAQRHGAYRDEIDKEIAFPVLVRNYSKEPKVLKLLANVFSGDEFLPTISFRPIWRTLEKNCSGETELAKAIDGWLQRRKEAGRIDAYETAHASLVSKSDAVKALLLSGLDEENSFTFWCMWALLEGWGDDEDVREALVECTRWPTDRVQYFAQYVPMILKERDDAKKILLDIAKLPKISFPDRLALGLSRLGEISSDKEIKEVIISLIETDNSAFDPTPLILALYPDDPRVRKVASDLVNASDAPLSDIASSYKNDSEIKSQLVLKGAPLPPSLRTALVDYAMRRCDRDDFLYGVMKSYASERDSRVRTAAAIGCCSASLRRNENIDDLLLALQEELQAVGVSYEGIRQSALAGVIALERFDIFVKEITTHDEKPLCIGIGETSRHDNNRLNELIANNWAIIRDSLGDTLYSRFSDYGGEARHSFWNALCPYLSVSEELKKSFLEYCESEEEVLSAGSLRALSRLREGRRLLLTHCKKALASGESKHSAGYDRYASQLQAGMILGSLYSEEEGVEEFLVQNVQEDRSGAISALALGWPEHSLVKEKYDELKELEKRRVLLPSLLHLAEKCADAARFSEIVLNVVNGAGGNIWEFLPSCVDSIVRRLSIDSKLEDILLDHLKGSPSVNEQSSLPRLLAASRSGQSELRDLCDEMIEAHWVSGRLPTLGFDIVAGKRRPIVHALYDVVMPYGPTFLS